MFGPAWDSTCSALICSSVAWELLGQHRLIRSAVLGALQLEFAISGSLQAPQARCLQTSYVK